MNLEDYILQIIIDPSVRLTSSSRLKPNMFESDASKVFLKTILQDKYKDVVPDPRIFAADFGSHNNITGDHITQAVDSIKKHTPLTNGKFDVAVESVNKFVKSRELMRNFIEYAKNPDNREAIENQIRNVLDFNMQPQSELFMDPSDISAIQQAREDELPSGGRIIKSHFNLINQSSQYKGYKYGDMILLCARPGGGKTTIAINEAVCSLKQGLKVAVIYLGDMSRFDASVRFHAVINNEPVLLDDVQANIEKYHTEENRAYLKNLRFEAFPAMQYDVYEVTSFLNQMYKTFQYDVAIIDYDSNIRETNSEMYKEGGIVYSHLKGFCKDKCVLFVLSQPKQPFWHHEIIPLEAASESSRKQHAVDFMLNIGVNKDCSQVGSAYLAKARRGTSNIQTKIRFDHIYGRVTEIDLEEYTNIIQTSSDNNPDSNYSKVKSGYNSE